MKLYKDRNDFTEENATDVNNDKLVMFCKTPRTRKEICEFLGLNSITYAIQTHVMPLVDKGIIKLSIPDKPTSSKQLFYSGVGPR